MTINYTTLLGLAEPVTGTESGTWGDDVNKGITDYLDIAIAGTQTISGTQTAVTLSVTNGSSAGNNISQAGTGGTGSAQYAIINCTGAPVSTLTVTVPASSRQYIVINATSTSQSVKIVGAGPTTGVTLVAGEKAIVVWNGSDYVKVASTAPGAAAGSNTQVQYNSSGNLAGSSSLTFDGTTLATTTLDATNVEVTNLKAKDGTAAASIADSTGVITVSTELKVDNLSLNGNTLSSTDTNGNVVVAPNGTGDVQLDADTVRIGDANSNATLTTNGTGDLILNTNSGTNSGSITIEDGVNGNIIIAPNGTGQVQISNVALDLTTLEVTNIKAKDGTASMTLADSTGVVSFSANPTLSGGTANGVAYLNGSKVLTTGSALTFDGTRLRAGGATVSNNYYIQTDGGVQASASVVAQGTLQSYSGAGLFMSYESTYGRIEAYDYGTSAYKNFALAPNGGNVGIGTSSPGYKLTVNGSMARTVGSGANGGFAVNDGTNDLIAIGTGGFAANGGTATDGGLRATNNMVFVTGSGSPERMRLDSSGNLLINTTSAVSGSKLVVASADATIYGITVGRGAGAVSTNTAVGVNALAANTSGTNNTVVGYDALDANTSGAYNNAFGRGALGSNTTGNNNIAIGTENPSIYGPLFFNTTGSQNTALGNGALANNTTASNNTAVGYQAGYSNTTGTDSIYLGYQSGYLNTGAGYNTAVGANSLRASGTGTQNTVVGSSAMVSNTDGSYNVAIGRQSMFFNTTASNNSALGYQSLYSNTIGLNNTAVGYQAAFSATTGVATFGTITGGSGYTNGTYNNVQLTYSSGSTAATYPTANITVSGGAVTAITLVTAGTRFQDTTTVLTAPAASIGGTGSGFTVAVATLASGQSNVAVGLQALYSSTTASQNVAVGQQALYAATTGGSNSALGYRALYSNTTGVQNTSVGMQSLNGNTGGVSGVSIGYQALLLNTTGSGNVAVGVQALYSNTTAYYNTAVGYQALYNANRTADTNAYNAAFGFNAGYAITTAQNNTLIGPSSGSAITTGSKNSILGAYTGNNGGLDIRTSSNYIVLSDGDGNPRQIIDSAGNLGLGVTPRTTTASYKAFEFGNSGYLAGVASSPDVVLASNAYIAAGAVWTYSTTAVATRYAQTAGTHTWSYAASGTAGNAISFTQAMTLDASGQLGIGTSSPGYKLDVSGSMRTTSFWVLTGSPVGAGGAARYIGGGGAANLWYYNVPTGGSQNWAINESVVMTLDSSGNLGIGASSPASRLDVYSTGNTTLTLSGSSGGGGDVSQIDFFRIGSNVTSSIKAIRDGNNTSGALTFYTAVTGTNSEKMRLDSSGNLGIGTTSPVAKLSVADVATPRLALQVGSQERAYLGYTESTFTTRLDSDGPLQFAANNAVAATIDLSGNLGIGTSSPSAKLHVVGSGLFSSNLFTGGNNTGIFFTGSTSDYTYGIGRETAGLMLYSGSATARATLDSSGNLGLGVTPSAWGSAYRTAFQNRLASLTGLAGTSVMELSANFYLDNTGTGRYIATDYATQYQQLFGAHKWFTAPSGTAGNAISFTQAMTLDASGNLLVGTTSATPANANGLIAYGGTDAGIVYLQRTTGTDQLRFYVGGNRLGYLNTASSAVKLGTANFPLIFATNDTERARIDANGNVLVTSSGGLGYGTGSGGAVTQATSRTTGVTLNKTNGAITLVSAAGTATWQTFTVTNSTVAATDTIIVNQKSGTDLYQIFVTAVAAGSFNISFATTGGTTTEQPVFNFAVIKAVTA